MYYFGKTKSLDNSVKVRGLTENQVNSSSRLFQIPQPRQMFVSL